MTQQELRQKAEEWVKDAEDNCEQQHPKWEHGGVVNAFLAGVELMQGEIRHLKEDINALWVDRDWWMAKCHVEELKVKEREK